LTINPTHAGAGGRKFRATAVPLRAASLDLLGPLDELANAVLHGLPRSVLPEPKDQLVVAAVLGTVLFEGLVTDSAWRVLAGVRRWDVDLPARLLMLMPRELDRARSPQRLRLSMDVRTALLWGRVLIRCSVQRSADPGPVLPPAWQEPRRLGDAMLGVVRGHGFPSWRRFVGAVRLAHVLGDRAPVTVARRAGRLRIASAGVADWRRAGWVFRESPVDSPGAVNRRSRWSGNRAPWFSAVRDVALSLDGQAGSVERRAAADRLARLASDPGCRATATACADPVLRWAVSLLRATGAYRPNTVRTWLVRLLRAGDTGLLERLVGPGMARDGTVVVRAILASCHSVETMLATRTTLRQFIRFAAGRGWPVAEIDWRLASLDIGTSGGLTSILTPVEIRAAAMALQDLGAGGEALAIAVILGGLAGLRRGEVCLLKTADVMRDAGWTIRIRHSKTRAGRRWIPLGHLAPAWALEMLDRYATGRAAHPAGVGVWLLRGDGAPWEPDVLGPRVRAVLRQVTHRPVTFHALRRSCATWWLVRWFEAAGYAVPAGLAADGPSPAGVRRVLGDDPTAVLWSLARLLGHSSPVVTLARYGQALEWIEAQQGLHSADVELPGPVAAEVLGVSERWARQLVPHKAGTVQAGALLEAVVRRLGAVDGSR
jgi:integrase